MQPRMYSVAMSKTIQIRDVDDDVYEGLRRHALDAGLSVPELLRREAARVANRPTNREWLERTDRAPSPISRRDVIDELDEIRGERPDARR